MKTKLIHEAAGHRTFAIILATDDEVLGCLKNFAIEANLTAASLTAIGAFRSAELAYFEWETKRYISIPVDEQVEVASLTGDVALDPQGTPALHIHAVLGKKDGSALAGHLSKAIVRPTLEVILTESPAHLRKRQDPETGLSLIALNA